ncbi:uncharacterized protein AKAME5_002257000 [Lates japonicus]|uniref:Ig-like domain-containing protein n=1 Tax=Lates japonicus TaxID=270547 RepID=A0AAD3RI10_LATJO|nr:uncharacterized protein AKAME5_002257000 [Lates japonicus]
MREVKVKAGEDVTLECQGPTHAPIEVLKWIRPDLMSDRGLEGYVFFYRDERSHESYHHQLFVGRVELRDPEMKDRDVSLILRNVSTNDTGRYEGHVSVSNTGRRKRAQSELWCVIKLTVEDPVIKKYKNRSQNYGPSKQESEEMAMEAQDPHSCDSPSHC